MTAPPPAEAPDGADREYDIANRQLVGSGFQGGESVISVMLPTHTMTNEQALVHAAWLVALADPMQRMFPLILAKVMST